MLGEIQRAGRAVIVDRQAQRPDAAQNEVGEEVTAPVRRPKIEAAIDITAGDGLAGAAIVFQYRIDQRQVGR